MCFQQLIGERKATMLTTPGMKKKCLIPWSSNEDMLTCMEDPERRKALLDYISGLKYPDSRSVHLFMNQVYDENMQLSIHNIE